MNEIDARLQALHLVGGQLGINQKLEDHLGAAEVLARWLISGVLISGAAPAVKETSDCDAAVPTKPPRPGRMSFETALGHLRVGCRIARLGWNGQRMFAYLVPATMYPAKTGAAKAHFGEYGMVPYRAYLALKTAEDDVATWAPSSSDVLAEDWIVLD